MSPNEEPPLRRIRPRASRSAPVLGLVLLAGACTPSTGPVESPVEPPAAFTPSGELAAPERWWTTFADSGLDGVVDRALEDNLDLRTAWERLREAEAVVGVVRGERFPDLELAAGGLYEGTGSDDDTRVGLGLSTNWEIDLWGRIGSQVEAERLRARATFADYRATALSLSAEVVRAWLQLGEARAQRELLQRQVEINQTSLTLLEARFGTGQVRSADILRQRQLLESTQEQVFVAEARIDVLRHRLAVLLGLPPTADLGLATLSLPELPPLPRAGVPAELVQRRPDVQSAWQRLSAADRDLAAAISARYPRLSITASLSTEGDAPGALFDDWLRSLAGNLVAPLFTGGELEAAVDEAEARRQQRVYEYGQAVLTAFREVEDSLVEERSRRRQLESLRVQVGYAEQTSARLRLEYFNGVGGFLDVLTAQIAQQQLERDLLAARLGLLENRVALYRALAGGFETEREQSDPSARTGEPNRESTRS